MGALGDQVDRIAVFGGSKLNRSLRYKHERVGRCTPLFLLFHPSSIKVGDESRTLEPTAGLAGRHKPVDTV